MKSSELPLNMISYLIQIAFGNFSLFQSSCVGEKPSRLMPSYAEIPDSTSLKMHTLAGNLENLEFENLQGRNGGLEFSIEARLL